MQVGFQQYEFWKGKTIETVIGFLEQYSVNLYKLIDVIINLSKVTECTTLGINQNLSYGLWMILMCQCRCIDFNKSIILGPDADSGGRYTCVGVRNTPETSVPSTQFCYKCKSVLKSIKIILNQ